MASEIYTDPLMSDITFYVKWKKYLAFLVDEQLVELSPVVLLRYHCGDSFALVSQIVLLYKKSDLGKPENAVVLQNLFLVQINESK